MKFNKFAGCLMIALFCLTAFAVKAQDMMTNAEVLKMVKAGFGAPVIIAKVKSTTGKYDLSLDSMIAMKKQGVSDEIVAAMLEANSRGKGGAATNINAAASGGATDPNDPLAPHGFGIYLFEEKDGGKVMTQLTPNVSAQNRTGGLFTSSLTYGIGKVKTKANLPGNAAKLQLRSSKPVFYFYLDSKSGGLNTASGIPSTPNEFTLIKFNVRSDNREVTIAKGNAFGAKGGLSDEYVKAFDVENVAEGIFKITPKETLPVGEYGFYLINSGNSNANAAVGSKFFDFGVNLR